MTNIKQSLVFILLMAGFILAGIFAISYMTGRATQANASVTRFAEYTATTTRAAITGVAMANLQVIQSGTGTFGSIVITGAGTGIINIYDGTSTVNNTAWATTTLAVIPASMAAGTYTFDVLFQKGLMIEYVGSVATSTITYRQN